MKQRKAALAERAEWLAEKENYIILDTETTGLDYDSEIVEIGIIDLDGTILFDSLIKPYGAIPEDATDIHGITNEMVAAAPAWYEVWPTIKNIITKKTIIAYNAEFDV